jgi:hypothetical protein
MKKQIIYSVLAVLTFCCVGCNKFDNSINTDTNNPSAATYMQLINNAALYLPGLSSSPQGEYNAQFLSETQYPNLSLYTQENFDFTGFYTGPLMNLEEVLLHEQDLNSSEWPFNNQMAIAKILKAYFFWHITDRWGDVPYTEALKGSEDFTPAYETQQNIYNNIFTLLDEASNMISGADISNDIIYNGDMDKWKKLANTIHLLAALRLSNADADKGKTEFTKALNAGIMTSNDDNLVFRHRNEESSWNFWFDEIENKGRYWWALSKLLVDHMKPVSDPRLEVYGDPNTAGEYEGLEYGTLEPSAEDPSLLGSAIWEVNAPVQLVTYAQALFAQAEAAKAGWTGGGDASAKDFYELAIEQSVLQWKNNTTGLSGMMANSEIAYDPAAALEQIATQRWIHLFMHGYEAWAEWRRTGYPALAPPAGAVDRAVPLRQAYPVTEQFNNKMNYDAAVQRQFGGTDNLDGKLWWDKP